MLSPTGWRLAPAFDINPNPAKSEHALTWEGKSAAPLLPTVTDTAAYYRLDAAAAQAIVEQVMAAVACWRERAVELSIPRIEIQMMEPVFLI